jgi:hypothetical protein
MGGKVRRVSMLKECVILDGKIINIGPWDDQRENVEIEPHLYDEEGNIEKQAAYEEQIRNPFPVGVVVEERDLQYDSERGWYEAGDNSARIAELKRNLSDTDYVIIKIAEGMTTAEEYADIIAQRQVWRAEINNLELSVD